MPPNAPNEIPSHEGGKGSKTPKMINLESTGIKRSARLDNKLEQKYVLFDKLSLLLAGARELA